MRRYPLQIASAIELSRSCQESAYLSRRRSLPARRELEHPLVHSRTGGRRRPQPRLAPDQLVLLLKATAKLIALVEVLARAKRREKIKGLWVVLVTGGDLFE